MCLASDVVKDAAQAGSSFVECDKALRALDAATKTFTRAEIAARGDLMVIEDKVYDADRFQWAHPGGSLFVAMFGGRDGTLAFQSYHMRAFPHEKMRSYLVGSLDAREVPTREDPEHHALAARLRPTLAAAGGSFAPKHQKVKAGCLWAAAALLEGYMICCGNTWAGCGLLGLLFAWIGLNVQHDANHGAMFRRGEWNIVWGLSQNWIGGSQVMWLQEHVVLHHMHTGDVVMDCDAQLCPAMRGHSRGSFMPWMRFQQYYFLLVEAGYFLVPALMAFAEVLAWSHKFHFPISRLARRAQPQSTLLHFGFYARTGLLPALAALRRAAPGAGLEAMQDCLVKQLFMVTVAGFYLAFFFFLSHNFDGVTFVEGANADGSAQYAEGSGFLKQQAASSSNVGGSTLCLVNGGLNFQIEHHLFPRIAHSHYPTIAPVVEHFVTSVGGQYVHFPTVGHNLASVFAYLSKYSEPEYA
eukprot:CAMPEP_0119270150 /NCGR_PEP_ID=MMETSP1329-20130426/7266_1 /TAXON_ID=114041 /ORGANISM="Genus nov. species nov., Strain RCC1024" /LENGTH=468 /DNA_ID=CAMNT_0007270159 /DNA_START=130 /DNA_END=1532 /DNA_ORIENTATION=+